MTPKVSLIERIKKDINLKKLSKVLEQLFQNTEIPNKEPRLNVGWAPAQTVTVAHGSNVPLTQFIVPYPEQWAVTRGASPYTFYTNIGEEPVGMMRNRRYWNKYKQTLRKPMVQVGEAVGDGKNNTRNQIMENAMSAGADGLILDGIADNKAKNVRVILSQTPENVEYLSTSEAFLGAPLQVGPKRKYIGKQHGTPKRDTPEVRRRLDKQLWEARGAVRGDLSSLLSNLIPSGQPQNFIEDFFMLGSSTPHTNTDGIDLMKEYASGLTDILPQFKTKGLRSSNGQTVPNAYVANYRRTLENMGYDHSSLTDEELGKIITDQYNQLVATQTGKAKGQVFWRSTPSWEETIDWRNTGQASGNTGAVGPANYFSTYASHYGYQYKDPTGLIIGDSEPFLINEVNGVVLDNYPRNGLGSQPINNAGYGHVKGANGWVTGSEKTRRDVAQMNSQNAKDMPINQDQLMVDHKVNYPYGQYSRFARTTPPIGVNYAEVGIRRNIGIKSLFAHPEVFKRMSDGVVRTVRSWKDPRINRAVVGGVATLSAAEALDEYKDDPVIQHMYAAQN